MRRLSLTIAVVLLLLASFPAYPASDPTYAALRAARPDGRVIALDGFTFERDALRFTLTGRLHLLSEVEGTTSGAVFIGRGTYELTPATAAERHQLVVQTADEKLMSVKDEFESAVFLGTALVAVATAGGPPAASTPDPQAGERWNAYLKRQTKDLHTNLHVRLLQEKLDDREPFLFAWIDGKKYPPAALIVDPRGAESVRLSGRDLGGEQTMMFVLHDTKGGIWYSSRYATEVHGGRGALILPVADAAHYEIDADIRGSELTATSTMTFSVYAPTRVLPIDLSGKLRIESASFALAAEQPVFADVPFVQEIDDADAAVIFPTALERGKNYLLRISYAGKDVLENAGDGNFTVSRRVNWYPNVGVFSDLATYELRFRTPQKFQIVAIGKEIENRVEGDVRIATWRADKPVRVAGFNYGRFRKLAQADPDSGMSFEVYTNPGTPDIIRQINYALSAASRSSAGAPTMHDHINVDTESLAQSALADGINTARTATVFFGAIPTKQVAITQQSQWFFGQSWPSLIYMPYVAFLNGTTRHVLGLTGTQEFVDNVGPHELAHQWWGHHVGFRSYRDEWLSEGFAEFTAALVAQNTGGWTRYAQFWERARQTILEKPRAASLRNDEAGPISMGWRLSTWRNPSAYGAIVYSKGAYVLHMLRMAMWTPQNGDEAFAAMMKEFATTHAGRNPSSLDFQSIVEKHAPASLRITRDGRLDWFFGQWVHGTAIPKLTSKLEFKSTGGGRYKVTGSITQSEVPENFATVIPIYAHLDKTNQARVGTTVLVGSTTKPVEFEIALPKKPQRFSINAMHDVLSR